MKSPSEPERKDASLPEDASNPRMVATATPVSGRDEYEPIVKRDRTGLLIRQLQLHEQKIPVVLLISGSQTSGYTRIINHLNEWMDARYIQTHVHQPDTDEESQRPFFWKYWRQSPPRGEIGLFLGGWYTDPYLERLMAERGEAERGEADRGSGQSQPGDGSDVLFQNRMREIRETERLWAADGALIVKIWLHLDKDDKRRNKEGKRNNRPHDAWQVTMDDWRGDHTYEQKMALVHRVFAETHRPHAPWYAVDASDTMQCNLTVMHLLTDLFEHRLSEQSNYERPDAERPGHEIHSTESSKTDSAITDPAATDPAATAQSDHKPHTPEPSVRIPAHAFQRIRSKPFLQADAEVRSESRVPETFHPSSRTGGGGSHNPDASPINPKPTYAELEEPLRTIDLSKSLKRGPYEQKMRRLWESLYLKSWEAYDRGQSLVVVFEGSDAAGKGGAIRRLTRCMDARLYRVIQTAAPTALEHAHHYLWRFWMQIPRRGKVTIYDRSWYGRVLVERVEGFADSEEWKRAYREINEFERQLCRSHTKILKFWLQISPEEQLKRFQKREKTPYKEFKLTEEDWRNRKRLDAYEVAVNEMIRRTHTDIAPWHLIPAENKRFARIQVLEAVERALEDMATGCA